MSLPPAGQWKPEPLPVGSRVEFAGGYGFTVTLHGPNVEHVCVGCGEVAYGLPDCPAPRCGTCRASDGLSLDQRRALQQHPPRTLG